jgi:type II secretory pathway pseudopilin PulG
MSNRKSILSILSTLSILSRPRRRRAGYTLIEIAFASLIIGVAFLVLIGLGRLAVQGSVDAENDTRSALLADDVFATLRGTSDTLCATGGPSAWASFWSTFTNGAFVPFPTSTNIPARYVDVTTYGTPLLYGDGTVTRLAFVDFSQTSTTRQWTAQIQITATTLNALHMGAAYDYVTGPAENVNLVTVTLHIWPNAFDRRERSRSFLTFIPYQGLYHGHVVE